MTFIRLRKHGEQITIASIFMDFASVISHRGSMCSVEYCSRPKGTPNGNLVVMGTKWKLSKRGISFEILTQKMGFESRSSQIH